MKTVSIINKRYNSEILQSIRQIADEGVQKNALRLHEGRNRIWRCSIAGHDSAIKSFGNSWIKSIIYIFRKTKARRSYENALELESRDISTPAPLAYIESRGMFNRLKACMYICLYIDTVPLCTFLENTGKKGLSDFARFVAYLHEKGILHHDLNSTNVRVKDENGKPRFSLIDINRMKFMPVGVSVNFEDRFNNITRFSSLDDDYIFFVKKYLKYANLPEELFDIAIQSKSIHDTKDSRIHKIKNMFRTATKTK